jgi:hypothetical protein
MTNQRTAFHLPADTGLVLREPGDHGPRISQRRAHDGPDAAFFSPAGMDKYFEEVLEPIQNRSAAIPKVTGELITCMVSAGPKYGIEFV